MAMPALPGLKRLERATNRVLSRWPDVVSAPAQDREAIVRDIQRRVSQNDWRGATLAEVVRAARVIFEPEFRSRISLTKVRGFFRRETRVSTNPAFLGAMASIYLATYEPAKGHTKRLAKALDSSKSRLAGRWPDILRTYPDLFAPGRPEISIAKAMIAMPDPWRGLQAKGFKNPHAGGMLRYAHLAFVQHAAPRLMHPDAVEQMLTWLKPGNREALHGGAAPAIEALLAPWIKESPPEDLKERLVEALLACYGDPRVRSAGAWDHVAEGRKNVMLRWLTGANIQFFLDVVTAVEKSHMWEPRREFWWSLYEMGEITAAWVAFSDAAVDKAHSSAIEDNRAFRLTFGKQIVGGGRKDTSLLILRMRSNCIVVEGSHSYKVHIFPPGHAHAPKLFEPEYDCERIRLTPGSVSIAHYSGWEWRVRSEIL